MAEYANAFTDREEEMVASSSGIVLKMNNKNGCRIHKNNPIRTMNFELLIYFQGYVELCGSRIQLTALPSALSVSPQPLAAATAGTQQPFMRLFYCSGTASFYSRNVSAALVPRASEKVGGGRVLGMAHMVKNSLSTEYILL